MVLASGQKGGGNDKETKRKKERKWLKEKNREQEGEEEGEGAHQTQVLGRTRK